MGSRWTVLVAMGLAAATAGCGEGARHLLDKPRPVVAPDPAPSPGRTHTVSGVVLEATASGNVALEGVHVEDSERHASTRTDAAGSFSLQDVAEGNAYIYVFKEGFRSTSRQFYLREDTRLEIVLVRAPQ